MDFMVFIVINDYLVEELMEYVLFYTISDVLNTSCNKHSLLFFSFLSQELKFTPRSSFMGFKILYMTCIVVDEL